MDAGPTVPQPIFEVVRPPKLVSWDHASLVSWYRECNHYVTKMRHRCAVTGEVFERVVATVKGAIQPEVLDIIAGYVLRRTLESITDNEVLQLIHTRSQTLVNEFVPDVQSLVRQSLHMDLSKDDCDARVFRYFQDFTRIVEENGLQGLIGKTDPSLPGYRDRMKARCRLLIENLQPLVLKEQIQRLVELERRDCKTDDVALFDLILVHAKAQQRYHRMSKEASATRGSQRQSSASSAGASGPKQGAPAARVQSLTALQPYLPIQRLRSPILVVVADGRPIECDCTVKVDLQLNTAAGVVNIPNVEFVVMDSQEEELLLGKDVLRDLGIDVDDMLAQLAHGADFVDDSDSFEVGDDSQEPRDENGVQDHLDRMVSEAAANGMDAEHVDELRSVLGRYPDVWQDSLRAGPPAKVEPLRIQLREGASPIRCRQRKYAPLQRQFIREHVALLAKNGLVRENRAARWASPVVPVRKPGTKDEFRLTIDYRAVNRATVPIAGTMPNPAALMEKVNGAVALAKFDMKNGFWQLPLEWLVRRCSPS